MKYVKYLLLQSLFFLLFTTNAYSQDSDPLATQFKSFNSIFMIPAVQDPEAYKIISDALAKHEDTEKRYQTIKAMMEKTYQNQKNAINDLRLKNRTLANIHDDNAVEMNFIDLRLMDAIFMLEAVTKSPVLTLDFINKMQNFAVEAANGTHSSSDLYALNLQFQAYKKAIYYAQHIGLLNGPKFISGGDITIRFGSEISDSSSLVIKIPAFDSKALKISDLDISTSENASHAIGVLQGAASILVKSVINTALYVTDGEAMLLNLPFMLHQNFMLDMTAKNIIMQAVNGTTSDDDRSDLNMALDWIKLSMNKTQTYLSLHGAKMTGGGKITIQIGKEPSPKTTLEIDLPATDIKVIGMDKLDIKTSPSAIISFAALLDILRDFAYHQDASLR